MEKLLSALTGVVLAVSFALPVSAAPIYAPQPAQVQTDAVEQVNHRRNWRDNHWNRRHAWRSCRYYGRCYPRHDYGRDYGYSGDYRYDRVDQASIST